MAGARAYVCLYCHDLDRSHAINDVTKKNPYPDPPGHRECRVRCPPPRNLASEASESARGGNVAWPLHL